MPPAKQQGVVLCECEEGKEKKKVGEGETASAPKNKVTWQKIREDWKPDWRGGGGNQPVFVVQGIKERKGSSPGGDAGVNLGDNSTEEMLSQEPLRDRQE